ncbi:MAG: prolyl oligopeptidase family serine peptidase [Alloprevotella sp.]|nr:prolyl oligopeptidase family serine peptidase [Alloprevotella sp.]
MKDLADSLATLGYATLRYDKRGKVYGARTAELSKETTYQTEVVDDALCALRWLYNQPEVDTTRIFVLGHSLSASLLPLIVSQSSVPLAGYIALAAPSQKLQKTLRRQLRYLQQCGQLTVAQKKQTEQQLISSVPSEYWKFDQAYNPVKMHRNLSLPMLYIQGSADYQVLPADLEAYRKKPAPHARYKILPAVNHLMGTNQQGTLAVPGDYIQRQIISPLVLEEIRLFLQP